MKVSLFGFFLIPLSKGLGLIQATWTQTFGMLGVAIAFWLLGMYEVFLYLDESMDSTEKQYLLDEIDDEQLHDHYRGKTNC
jgi:hypothetical protein